MSTWGGGGNLVRVFGSCFDGRRRLKKLPAWWLVVVRDGLWPEPAQGEDAHQEVFKSHVCWKTFQTLAIGLAIRPQGVLPSIITTMPLFTPLLLLPWFFFVIGRMNLGLKARSLATHPVPELHPKLVVFNYLHLFGRFN